MVNPKKLFYVIFNRAELKIHNLMYLINFASFSQNVLKANNNYLKCTYSK